MWTSKNLYANLLGAHEPMVKNPYSTTNIFDYVSRNPMSREKLTWIKGIFFLLLFYMGVTNVKPLSTSTWKKMKIKRFYYLPFQIPSSFSSSLDWGNFILCNVHFNGAFESTSFHFFLHRSHDFLYNFKKSGCACMSWRFLHNLMEQVENTVIIQTTLVICGGGLFICGFVYSRYKMELFWRTHPPIFALSLSHNSWGKPVYESEWPKIEKVFLSIL